MGLSEKQFQRVLKKKKEIKSWETLIVSNNLSWENFSKINNNLYDLNGVKPVISISRNYPFREYYTHVLGYVSQLMSKTFIKRKYKGKNLFELKVGKTGLKNFRK